MHPHYRNLLFRILAVVLAAYWVALFYSTHQSVAAPDLFDHFDKLIHFGAYAVLAGIITLLLILRYSMRSRIAIWVWTIAAAYGAIDEYTQKFCPDREPDKLDLLADCLGAAVGIAAAFALVRLVKWVRDSRVTLSMTRRPELSPCSK
jgi:VanZ family protein